MGWCGFRPQSQRRFFAKALPEGELMHFLLMHFLMYMRVMRTGLMLFGQGPTHLPLRVRFALDALATALPASVEL